MELQTIPTPDDDLFRRMLDQRRVMLTGTIEGYAVDVAIQAEQFSLARRLMAELTAEHTGQPVERIVADGDRDRWFTAQEALAYGMVDDVIGARARVVTSPE